MLSQDIHMVSVDRCGRYFRQASSKMPSFTRLPTKPFPREQGVANDVAVSILFILCLSVLHC